MKRQAFQPGEIRDENDTIIREGAYGKKSAFATADNKGILDYMINNFDALKDAIDGGRVYVASASDLPATGDVANVYVTNDTGKWYYWDPGTSKYVTIDNARTVANEAISARDTAKAWAESSSSPDGATDSDSSTGKTQSSKSWALYSKDRATASASSASASASSASAAKTSQSAAASSASAASSSASAASTSATNAKNSQTAAASSASAAKTSETNAATSETNAKTALVSCQNIQTQVNNGLQSLTSAVKYRGSVASFSALPTSGQSVGDMYNVKAAGGTDANGTAIRAGDNVVWNGSGWDDQAGTVDLSNYYTKSEINGAVVSATVSDATLTLIHKDASKSTVTVNNVAHAGKASQDDKGQTIDIAALKTLITDTVNTGITTALQKVFPVGSIYTSVTDSRNPNAILGFGTWEALPAGYGLVAQGTATAEDGSTLTFTAGNKYGEFKHQLTVGELASHDGHLYDLSEIKGHGDKAYLNWLSDALTSADTGYGFVNYSTSSGLRPTYPIGQSLGGNKYHNNLSACIAVYCWRRTA
ncbi:hypothetical protein [uncultured Megasphaera sp.]|uniref:phage baseplate protein n=1 Tax=uncultured Megasphaera sp. TaxID=165188 RepID=UPI0025F8FA63|nr:hypothetical protein [uncultured Megasphaera sp.]